MRCRWQFVVACSLVAGLVGCEEGADHSGAAKTEAALARLVRERQADRAYEGAPPVVPHAVRALGRLDCLACHAMGDAVDNGRRAKITPHPEYVNCRQCHVEQRVGTLFSASTLVPLRPGAAPDPLQPLGPNYIPHRLQDRADCAVCHLGPNARPELVPAHGVRTNCQQCHLQLMTAVDPFVAAGGVTGR